MHAIRKDHAAFAHSERLGRMHREDFEHILAKTLCRARTAETGGVVDHDGDAALPAYCQLSLPATLDAERRHQHDHARAGFGEGPVQQIRRQSPVRCINVCNNRSHRCPPHGPQRGRKGKGREQNLTSSAGRQQRGR